MQIYSSCQELPEYSPVGTTHVLVPRQADKDNNVSMQIQLQHVSRLPTPYEQMAARPRSCK